MSHTHLKRNYRKILLCNRNIHSAPWWKRILLYYYLYRYDSRTGTFTVPHGGDGFYYFSVYLYVHGGITAGFNVELNDQLICTVFSDLSESAISDSERTSCSGVTYAIEGIYTMLHMTFYQH